METNTKSLSRAAFTLVEFLTAVMLTIFVGVALLTIIVDGISTSAAARRSIRADALTISTAELATSYWPGEEPVTTTFHPFSSAFTGTRTTSTSVSRYELQNYSYYQ